MTDFNKIIDQTSLQIRSAIEEDMAPTPRPYHPSDVNSSAIPNQLEHLLVGLLTGDPDCGKSAAHGSPLLSGLSARTLYVTGSEKRGHFGANFFSIFLAKHEVYLFSFNMNYNLPFKSL